MGLGATKRADLMNKPQEAAAPQAGPKLLNLGCSVGGHDAEGLDQVERPQQRGHPGGDIQRAEASAEAPDGQRQGRDHRAVLHHRHEPLSLREPGLHERLLARFRQAQELCAVMPLPFPPVAGFAAVDRDVFADQPFESLSHVRPPSLSKSLSQSFFLERTGKMPPIGFG